MADHISHSIEDLKVKLNQAEQALKEQQEVNKEILKWVDKLVKEKVEKEEEHIAEMQEVIAEAKSRIVEVVWEENIKLVEDI